jgi:fused
LLINHP